MLRTIYHCFDTTAATGPPPVLRAGWQAKARLVKKPTGAGVMSKPTNLDFPRRRAETDFERLVRPHLDHLYRLAYRFTGAVDRAEDLIQDLLLRLYPRRAELARVELPRPWLARVMYRMFIDQVRRDARSPFVPDTGRGPAHTDDEREGDLYAEIADPAPGPEAEMELNVNRGRLARAWERLSPEHKALLALHDIEGYTLNELAISLETPLGTLKSRLHRAHARLAHLLKMERFEVGERVHDNERGAM
jgi:RNA polymerase sigma-70 factor (ECF subfamily)